MCFHLINKQLYMTNTQVFSEVITCSHKKSSTKSIRRYRRGFFKKYSIMTYFFLSPLYARKATITTARAKMM